METINHQEEEEEELELQQAETAHSPETSKEVIMSKPAFVVGSGTAVTTTDIVDRCLTWAKQRQQRKDYQSLTLNIGLEKAQEEHKRHQEQSSECTFKPDLKKPTTSNGFYPLTQSDMNTVLQEENQKKGFDKYLQRMDKAKQIKADRELLEDQLFHREKKWKAQITQPQEPKLSAFINKKERDVQVKALNKPVDIHENCTTGSNQATKAQSLAGTQHNGSHYLQKGEDIAVKIEPGQGIKHTQEFIKITQKNKDKYIEIKAEMSYDDAVSLIHQHILNLEL